MKWTHTTHLDKKMYCHLLNLDMYKNLTIYTTILNTIHNHKLNEGLTPWACRVRHTYRRQHNTKFCPIKCNNKRNSLKSSKSLVILCQEEPWSVTYCEPFTSSNITFLFMYRHLVFWKTTRSFTYRHVICTVHMLCDHLGVPSSSQTGS